MLILKWVYKDSSFLEGEKTGAISLFNNFYFNNLDCAIFLRGGDFYDSVV